MTVHDAGMGVHAGLEYALSAFKNPLGLGAKQMPQNGRSLRMWALQFLQGMRLMEAINSSPY